MKKIILLILLQTLIVNCQNKKHKEYYENGNLKKEVYYTENGKEKDKIIEYYENGNLRRETTFLDGKPSGDIKEYHDNGKLWLKRNYLNGVLVGHVEEYYDNGYLFVDGSYNDIGERSGEYKFYHEENGKIWKVGRFKKGKQDGEWKVYHKNKKLYQIQLWDNGKYMEIISCFNSSEQPLDKGTLKNGYGTVKEYVDGKMVEETEYLNGIKI